jgi:hypothetical protein
VDSLTFLACVALDLQSSNATNLFQMYRPDKVRDLHVVEFQTFQVLGVPDWTVVISNARERLKHVAVASGSFKDEIFDG